MDPYEVDPDMCEYQDIQRLKLQEAPENVPTGELPRHVMLSADRGLVGAVVPGTRVTVRAQPHCSGLGCALILPQQRPTRCITVWPNLCGMV